MYFLGRLYCSCVVVVREKSFMELFLFFFMEHLKFVLFPHIRREKKTMILIPFAADTQAKASATARLSPPHYGLTTKNHEVLGHSLLVSSFARTACTARSFTYSRRSLTHSLTHSLAPLCSYGVVKKKLTINGKKKCTQK